MSGSKWANVDAGPRQVKDFNQAISSLRGEGQTRTELYGVIGGNESSSTVQAIMGPVRAEVVKLLDEIGERYGWKVTKGNVRQIIADLDAAHAEAVKSRPVDDNRRTPEQEAERNAASAARAAAENAEQAARDAVMTQVMRKAPHGAKALIIAEWHEDTSDPMSDYTGSRVTRTVAIGFRSSSREDFRALRSAAGQFKETAHMASDESLAAWLDEQGVRSAWRAQLEHRDNYSLGAGNYLSDHGSARGGTGWVVRSAAFPCKWVHLTEDATPDAAQWAADLDARCQAAARERDSAGPNTVTVRPSSIGRAGVVEIVFERRPSAEVREGLKLRGFRWNGVTRCWYGTDTEYAQTLAA